MLNIPLAKPDLNGNEIKNTLHCLITNWISSQGDFVNQFETEFAKYCGVKYGIATANGTVALHLALTALEIGAGDEVIVPDLTFISPINMIIFSGARPVLIDVLPNNGTIDPQEIKKNITPRTKAIIAVHLYGQPCQMDKIMALAKKHNLFVIEDCAEAHGAKYQNQKIGGFGVISCFSFFANKIITTGEGGMCLTNDQKLAEKMRVLLNHGMNKKNKKYWHEILGFNYRLTNLQAGIGLAQLEKIDLALLMRSRISSLYNFYLKNTFDKIKSLEKLPNANPVCWFYSLIINEDNLRDKLLEKLKENNIETRPFFYPAHIMPPYQKYIRPGQHFPVSEDLAARGFNLPTFVGLKELQIKYICEILEKNLSDFYN